MLTELTYGNLIFAAPRVEELCEFLAQEGLLAAVEWEASRAPEAEDDSKRGYVYLVCLAIADGHLVAVGGDEREPVLVPGPAPAEVLARLTERFEVDARIGLEVADTLPVDVAVLPVGDDERPRSVRCLIYVPVRGFVAPLVAQGEGVTMAARENESGTFLVCETPDWDGPDLLQWPEAVMIRREVLPVDAAPGENADAHLLAVFGQDHSDWIIHDWSVQRRVVAGALTGPAATGMAESVLAAPQGSFPALAQHVSGVDAEALELSTLSGGDEAVRYALAAVGAPADLADYVMGNGELTRLDDVVLHEPRGVANAIGRSIQMWEDSAATESPWWRGYEQVVQERPKLIGALAAAESAIGCALLYVASRKRFSAPKRVLAGLVGAGFLLDAASELALAAWLRRRGKADQE
ncbi:hypothetical protein [Buchananella felis]|uniref:hypothetical protein n=1 Tax=Buchananella felis TaxID=3231492 RepID=UPI0035277498